MLCHFSSALRSGPSKRPSSSKHFTPDSKSILHTKLSTHKNSGATKWTAITVGIRKNVDIWTTVCRKRYIFIERNKCFLVTKNQTTWFCSLPKIFIFLCGVDGGEKGTGINSAFRLGYPTWGNLKGRTLEVNLFTIYSWWFGFHDHWLDLVSHQGLAYAFRFRRLRPPFTPFFSSKIPETLLTFRKVQTKRLDK